ncbi:RagB/SusD family nutrient uptake outer membrane protein [Neolewinella aurantiaca]|uniref:RagB/SusD family nutrient uptake outer membrane protein n=1 Tax=Neolewinella aurantiaca TaxID=2602767 RepID=A0A5C7FQ41_9BACT|nr:RagB/SusD family nutrient uptake outer membrane protein [Neolewinella aurantiaca]TXF89902.1 RagB/SusD family nutrient uptake outer membrane protein [Neolewinella aurantiaca]
MKALTRFFLLPLASLLMAGLLWTCSDDFLEVAPRGSLDENVLSSEAGIEGALLGAYSQLGGRGNYFSGASNWANGSIQGGEANKGTNDGDFTEINELVRYQLQSTSRIPSDRWIGIFDGITRANSALKLLSLSDDVQLTEADRARIEGEARFLRGHYYFQLKISYNQAPFLTPELSVEEQQMVVSSEDIWDEIEADFRFGYENLPETLAEAGRANKWAAGAYLGKTLLYQEKWGEARTVLNDVVTNGKTTNGQSYGLLDNYADAFNAEFDNSKESVFAVQAAANSGTTNVANPDMVLNFPHNNGPGNCCGFFQPSFDLANSFRTSDGLPLLDNSYNSEENRLVTDFGVAANDAFTPDDGPVDPRLDHSVGRRGIPYLGFGPHPGVAYVRDQPYGGPYTPKKFVYYADQEGSLSDGTSWTKGYGSMNYNIIRFADVLLMLAEAEIESDNLDAGRDLINQVRERAALSSSMIMNDDGTPAANYEIANYDSFADKAEALSALYMERKLELSGEGHRFFDLVRWGVAKSELDRIIANEQMFLPIAYSGASFTTPQDLYYPIPQGQIDLQGSDVLPQNPGY